jgi:hypothetical protein
MLENHGTGVGTRQPLFTEVWKLECSDKRVVDLRNICIPEGALRVEIDEPENRLIEEDIGFILGWFATRDGEIPETFEFRIGGILVPHRVVDRADVESVLPDYTIVGFLIPYDLSFYLPQIQNNRLLIQLTLPGYNPHILRLGITENALATCVAAACDV